MPATVTTWPANGLAVPETVGAAVAAASTAAAAAVGAASDAMAAVGAASAAAAVGGGAAAAVVGGGAAAAVVGGGAAAGALVAAGRTAPPPHADSNVTATVDRVALKNARRLSALASRVFSVCSLTPSLSLCRLVVRPLLAVAQHRARDVGRDTRFRQGSRHPPEGGYRARVRLSGRVSLDPERATMELRSI